MELNLRLDNPFKHSQKGKRIKKEIKEEGLSRRDHLARKKMEREEGIRRRWLLCGEEARGAIGANDQR